MALLVDIGAAIHVAGALWWTRPKILPCVDISTRAVGVRVSASLGQGTLLIDFAEATGALLTDLELFGAGAVSFLVAAIATVCADPVECPPELNPCMAPMQVTLVGGIDPSSSSPPSGKPRRRACTSPAGRPRPRSGAPCASLGGAASGALLFVWGCHGGSALCVVLKPDLISIKDFVFELI